MVMKVVMIAMLMKMINGDDDLHVVDNVRVAWTNAGLIAGETYFIEYT